MRRVHRVWATPAVLVMMALAGPALAQPGGHAGKLAHAPITVKTLEIKASAQRPLVAVAVARVRPVLSKAPRGPELLSRIESDAARLSD